MNSKKIKLLIIGAIATFITVGVGCGIKNYKKINEERKSTSQMIDENSNSFNEKDEEKYNEYQLDDALEGFDKNNQVNSEDIVVEEGFTTSIGTGNTDEEIRYNNKLLSESKFSLKERIKAKNVAENFVQAITSFDIEKPKETVDLAVKYVADALKEEVESLYMYLGKNESIKKCIIDEVESYEVENKYDNDYIIFNVRVGWSTIDQYDQISNDGHDSYEVKLLKINDDYKVVEYGID